MSMKMVKVNLLHDQQSTVEVKRAVRKVSGVTQQLLMLGVAAFALVTLIGLDYFYHTTKSKQVKDEVAQQEARANELKKLADKRAELVRQKQAVDDRIAIIKQLRNEQSGPVAMLSRINQKIPANSLYLFIIKNTPKGLALVGRADNEEVVQQFAHNLEYSDGLFTGAEVTTVLPAKFSNKDKLIAHISEMMTELEVDEIDIDNLAGVKEDVKDNASSKPVLFVLKCAFNNGAAPGQATAGDKKQVAALR